MKRFPLWNVLIMTLSFLACSSLALAQQAGSPRMVLKEKIFDQKAVEQGAVIEHTFDVANEGDQPLQIKKVEPG